MAHNFESALDTTSSTPNSSPSDILGDTKTRRLLVKIPSAQKDLLRRHETWVSFMSRRPHGGFINVPPDVLDGVKASYARQRRAAELNSVDRDGTDAPEPSGSQSSSPSRVENGNEDVGEDTSWSQSPESHFRPPRVESEEPDQPFITQLNFEKSPPQPTIVTSPLENSKPLEFPQSSQGPEDELEVEVPVALAYNLAPINKSALPMLATPPSAQVVPSTFEQSIHDSPASASGKSDPQRKPKPKKRIYKHVPELYRRPKQDVMPSHLTRNISSTKAIVALSRNTDLESSLSTPDMSSSIVPSTTTDRRIESEKHTEFWDIRPDQTLAYDANLSPQNPRSPLAQGRYSPAQITPLSPRVIQPHQAAIPVTRAAAPPVVASKSWEAPFVHYTVTYPNYNGTIQDFITACIYIQLQHRRIRTSLYDDFIRAWAEGYLPYIKDCDEAQPPRKALRAIEWYNEIDDDPLFTSRVVTRQNLQSILSFYPNELEIARISLGNFSSQGPSEHSVSNSRTEPHAQESYISQSLTSAQQLKGKEATRKSAGRSKTEARVSRVSPTLKAKILPFASDKQIPASISFSGIENRPAQHNGSTRSLSESTEHNKRVAIDELRSEGAKRIFKGPTLDAHSRMWSDSGSTATSHSERSKDTPRTHVAPESTTKKESAKTAEDPKERRARKLKEHFKKQKAKRDSIASSAPITNTPTLTQK
ncbi:hypothetical protein GGR58DRAFT_464089 [Xylaria digitata]|nr:hypothetical protein GGR58DRAFT_464089 [Xylaria digitata]